MRKILIAAAALGWIAAPVNAAETTPTPKPNPSLAGKAENPWRDVRPENLLLIETKYGQTWVELAPEFAPKHAQRVRDLTKAGFYDGTSFYRVIDGFVAQGGVGEDVDADGKPTDPKRASWPVLKREFDSAYTPKIKFTPLGNPDLFAPEAGYANGFAAGRDPKEKRTWMIHCPGTFAFARDNDGDSATTEFYVVIGEAPRRLDRNLTAFGRVIEGMAFLQKLERGDPAVNNGVIADKDKADKILRMRMASDLPADEQPHFQVLKTESRAFAELKDTWKNPAPGFYVRTPPPVLDVCLKAVPVRRKP